MFAYCRNNPVNSSDYTGEFGISALCTIGAVAGGVINYAAEVIQNHKKGLTGYDAWVGKVNWGGVAASAFSGALAAIPGAGTGVAVCDAVGSTLIEHGLNYALGESSGTGELVTDFTVNVATSVLPVDKIPGVGKLPQFIRNIKDEAVEMGIKGTKKLQTYLDCRQVTTIITSSFHSSTIGQLADAYLKPIVNKAGSMIGLY